MDPAGEPMGHPPLARRPLRIGGHTAQDGTVASVLLAARHTAVLARRRVELRGAFTVEPTRTPVSNSGENDAADASPRPAVVRAGSSIRWFLDRWAPLGSPSWLGRLFGVSPLPRESGRDYREADTEFAVAERVGSLGDEWHVVHGMSLCGDAAAEVGPTRDDVSHVVIGERGVFAITVVNPSGLPVWLSAHSFVHDGVRMAHLRDAEYNALRLSQQLYERCGLRVEVMPGVVVANPRRLIIDRPPLRVAVLRPNDIASWVNAQSTTLSALEVGLVARTAHALAYLIDGSTLTDVLSLFGAIHERVRHARSRRVGWIALGLLAVWILLVAMMGWG